MPAYNYSILVKEPDIGDEVLLRMQNIESPRRKVGWVIEKRQELYDIFFPDGKQLVTITSLNVTLF